MHMYDKSSNWHSQQLLCLSSRAEAEPFRAVFANSKIGYEATVAAVCIGIAPIILEARKDLTPEDKRKEDAAFRPIPFL